MLQNLELNENDYSQSNTVFSDTIEKISKVSATLGLDLVEISGAIETVVLAHSSHKDDFKIMAKKAAEILHNNQDMGNFASQASSAIEKASYDTRLRVESAIEALDTVRDLAEKAQLLGAKMSVLTQNLNEVSEFTRLIESVASATTMIALNATIEAARAGEAGRGFAVVAQEIKNLATQTKNASYNIQKTLSNLRNEVVEISETSDKTVDIANRMNDELETQTNSMNQIMVAFEQVSGLVANVNECANLINNETTQMHSEINRLEGEVVELDEKLHVGTQRLEKISLVGEEIMQLTSSAGVKNADSEFVELALFASSEIGKLFANAIANGEIDEADLFDENYIEIPGTQPSQFRTKFLKFTDANFPKIQERILETNSSIVFCAAVDRNGYLPTHNKKFSLEQRQGQTEWNTSNCRNRRIFNDRVGLRAGKNTNGILVQAYRRDMGNGSYVMMKDVSAPIKIGNKYWGGFRIGVRVD